MGKKIKGVNRLVPLAHRYCKYRGFSTTHHEEAVMLRSK